MKSFKICGHNLRKFKSDYRIWVVIAIIFVASSCRAQPIQLFAESQLEGAGVAPWVFVFSLTKFSVSKLMMLFPFLLLFCDAPFIDANQPYVISRCSRVSWGIGQILYIAVVSAITVLVMIAMSILPYIGDIDFTLGWGEVMYTAAQNTDLSGALAAGISTKIVNRFSPMLAMFYTFLLTWLTGMFIGLLIYVMNVVTNKNYYGITLSVFFLLFDAICGGLTSVYFLNPKLKELYYFSPISWCSLDQIRLSKIENYPSITYVLCAYAVLIVGLSTIAILASKKQEIKVVQSV